MICWEGGYEPGSSWHRHWSPAAAVNIGQPTGSLLPVATVFATGTDPTVDATTALTALSTIGGGNMTVTGVGPNLTCTFMGALAAAAQNLMTVDVSTSGHRYELPRDRYLPGTSSLVTGEIQTVNIAYALNGTAIVSFRGQSAPFAFFQNSRNGSNVLYTQINMQAALNSLSTIGGVGGSVTMQGWFEGGSRPCVGDAMPFGGTLAGQDLGGDLITVSFPGANLRDCHGHDGLNGHRR